MLWLILGDYGEGKTLRLAIEPFTSIYRDRDIWGNFTLKHPNYRKIEILDLRYIGENKLVLLDEMQNWFNSHETFSPTNDFLTDFIHDCDKKSIDVFGTSHRFMSLDINFRNGCHRIIKCERIGMKTAKSRLEDKRDFRFSIISTYSGEIIEKTVLKYEKAIPYFKVFNTKEKIYRFNQKDRDLKLLMQHNPAKGTMMLREIAKKIKEKIKEGKKLTHAELENEMGDLGYGNTFARRIYKFIKEA